MNPPPNISLNRQSPTQAQTEPTHSTPIKVLYRITAMPGYIVARYLYSTSKAAGKTLLGLSAPPYPLTSAIVPNNECISNGVPIPPPPPSRSRAGFHDI